MSQVEIRTPRLLLRGVKQDDLDAFHECLCDPETTNFWSTPVHTSLSQTQDFLDSSICSPYNGVLNFAVCLLGTSNPSELSSNERQIVIGSAGVWNGEEVGFIINRAYWRKGYAFEALSAVMQQYRSTRKAENGGDKIKADVDPRNKACLRLLDKLGFQVVGHAEKTYKTQLGWCDSVYLEANWL